jgi:hypothetical protein
MEHIIHCSVLTHLENTNLLSDEQHGFRKRRSWSKGLRPFLVELQMQQE